MKRKKKENISIKQYSTILTSQYIPCIFITHRTQLLFFCTLTETWPYRLNCPKSVFRFPQRDNCATCHNFSEIPPRRTPENHLTTRRKDSIDKTPSLFAAARTRKVGWKLINRRVLRGKLSCAGNFFSPVAMLSRGRQSQASTRMRARLSPVPRGDPVSSIPSESTHTPTWRTSLAHTYASSCRAAAVYSVSWFSMLCFRVACVRLTLPRLHCHFGPDICRAGYTPREKK